MQRIWLDRSRCQGHGNCYNFHFELFTPDEEAFAEVKARGALDADQLSGAQAAAADCPERAISVGAVADATGAAMRQ